jgi:Family of unknown function (DUF5681)
MASKTAGTAGKKQRTGSGKTVRIVPHGRRFAKGVSGNPKGRPQGSRSKSAVAGEQILESARDSIFLAAVDGAQKGDPTALRLCVERLYPLRKGRPVKFPLPSIKTPGDVVKALADVSAAMADGELSPDEATAIAGVIEISRKAFETCDLAAEVEELKKHFAAMGQL